LRVLMIDLIATLNAPNPPDSTPVNLSASGAVPLGYDDAPSPTHTHKCKEVK